MTLSSEALKAIQQEETILRDIIVQLNEQLVRSRRKFGQESQRARDLTSQIVSAQQVEDKQLLASDEAVAHALSKLKVSDIDVLEQLLDQPYFGRVVVAEEVGNGKTKTFDYKIGKAANPDCRIIDWKKAPISKLYYEYKQGDEFSETILGRERNGKILLRNSVEIKNGRLLGLSCAAGTFRLEMGQWKQVNGAVSARSFGNYQQLPDILALITAEQFDLITGQADSALLIQGIAGSGKTSVALHRLAWMLSPGNSELQSDDLLVLLPTQTLKTYARMSLAALGVKDVKTLIVTEWLEGKAVSIIPETYLTEHKLIRRPQEPLTTSIKRVYQSIALLKTLEELTSRENDTNFSALEFIETLLASTTEILSRDTSRLLTRELIEAAHKRFLAACDELSLDSQLDALFVLAQQSISNKSTSQPKLGHVFVDEVQDLSPAELACIISAVKKPNDLTLAGDIAQKTSEQLEFNNWHETTAALGLSADVTRFISLNVSHRSTRQIMALADYVQERNLSATGRTGKAPIHFLCGNETRAISATLRWLEMANEKYPNSLSAVICNGPRAARQMVSLLTPAFGGAVQLLDSNDLAPAGIMVSYPEQVKGLEFFNVLIFDASQENYSPGDFSRNRLYIAITRAEENLCLVNWRKPSALLPDSHKHLLRVMQLQS